MVFYNFLNLAKLFIAKNLLVNNKSFFWLEIAVSNYFTNF